MLEYARWKYILVTAVLFLGLIFALPNVFGEDPALQVARKDRAPVTAEAAPPIEAYLKERGVTFEKSYIDAGRLMLRFPNVPERLKPRVAATEHCKDQYVTALPFRPRAPAIFRSIGLRPMPLGLDLRGGLYLLYQVDVNGAVTQWLGGYAQDARPTISTAHIPLKDVSLVKAGSSDRPNGIRIVLPPEADVNAARNALTQALQGAQISTESLPAGSAIVATLTPAQIKERQDYAIQQVMTVLRNRVNELGVSEPIVQRQGLDRINVQLPGVQNSAEVKDLLGKVATLEMRLVDTQNSAVQASQSGHPPLGSKLYKREDGSPILLKREVIVTGDELTSATSTASQEGPAVSIKLDARGAESMLRTTRL